MELNGEHSLMIEENESKFNSIDPKRSRFPCCIVWTPLPGLSWFVPFVGHIGICREDGVILDFAGPNFVCVDNFTFGAPTRYIQLSKEQVELINMILILYFQIKSIIYVRGPISYVDMLSVLLMC